MAGSAECILRQLLVQFQVLALKEEHRLGVVPRDASFYEKALRDATLSTSKEVVQKKLQLQSLLGNEFTPAEIESVRVAAYALTGVKDGDKFDSSKDMKRFAEDENFREIADVVEELWEMGFRSCAAIDRVSEHDSSALPKLVKAQKPHVIPYLKKFAGLYSSKKKYGKIASTLQ